MNLETHWVVGFVDGEGCFYVGINRHPEMTTGYQVLPEFRVVQHVRDVQVLYGLKRFFKCGVVRVNHGDRWEYRVRKLEHLKTIARFFELHPLRTKKRVDFQRFARIVRWMDEGRHLDRRGLEQIIETAARMNRGDSETLIGILAALKTKSG